MAARRFALLALCCALAANVEAWPWPHGPTNFRADVNEKGTDLFDVELKWEHASCFLSGHTYDVKYRANGGEWIYAGSTNDNNVAIPHMEYWTNYTFKLETECVGMGDPPTVDVAARPGRPHPVESFKVTPDATFAFVQIHDSSDMPRSVDSYNVTVCTDEHTPCNSTVFDSSSVGAVESTTINGLEPRTHYAIQVSAVIKYEDTLYVSAPVNQTFFTRTENLPLPQDFESVITNTMHGVNVTVTWTLNTNDTTDVEFIDFKVVLEDANGKVLGNGTTTKSEWSFAELPPRTKMVLYVTPSFKESGEVTDGVPGVYHFTTPALAILPPTNFTFANINAFETMLGWTIPKGEKPEEIYYNLTFCAEKCIRAPLFQTPNITLKNLLNNTRYEVILVAQVRDSGQNWTYSTPLNESFTTRAEDWPTPDNINGTVKSNNTNTATYTLTWAMPTVPELAFFRVTYCDSTNGCNTTRSNTTSLEADLSYFERYQITIDAVYHLNLSVVIIKTSNTTALETVGTNPGPVSNLIVTDYSEDVAALTWEAPVNVPPTIHKNYIIDDKEHSIAVNSDTESFNLTKLAIYTNYSVSVRTQVTYNNVTYTADNVTTVHFHTDVGAPGNVTGLVVEQVSATDLFMLHWTAPEVANGPLDYYAIRAYDENGERIGNDTIAVGTMKFTAKAPNNKNHAKFSFGVVAVNINHHNKTIEGIETKHDVVFQGLDSPLSAKVVQRTNNSLFVDVEPAESAQNDTKLYYLATAGNVKAAMKGNGSIEVAGLESYTKYTISVQACYSPAFCSGAVEAAGQTNVGGPGPVKDLTSSFDKLNLTNPRLKWEPPAERHGPLDGYQIVMVDLADPEKAQVFYHNSSQDNAFDHESDLEYEEYNFTVRGFNLDLDDNKTRVFGVPDSVYLVTSGKTVPKPNRVHQSDYNSTFITFVWEAPAKHPDFDVTSYEVVVGKHNETIHDRNYTLDGLQPYTDYHVAIKGCTDGTDHHECGEPRNFTAKTDVAAPSKPEHLELSGTTTDRSLATWAEPKDKHGPIDGYKFVVRQGDKDIISTELDRETRNFTITGLQAGTEYKVSVVAYNNDHHAKRLSSEETTTGLTTSSNGLPTYAIVLIGVLVLAVIGAIGGGIYYYKKRQASGDDTDGLIHA